MLNMNAPHDIQATLQVAGGDRANALKMLGDPDSLMANETIQRVIAEGVKSSEAELDVVEGHYPEGAGSESERVGEAGESKGGRNGASAGESGKDRI